MSQYLSEAFKSLDSLNEDIFSVNENGLNDLVKFEEEDEETNIIDIIDAEAETDNDLEDSYEGKIILDCSICHSKQYKNIEDVVIEGDLANVGEECPFCYTNDGFKIVGQVAPFNKDEVEEEPKNDKIEDNEDANEEDDKIEESLNEATATLSRVEGTLGNVLTVHADELSKVYDAQSAIELLDKLEPEISQKDYLKKVKLDIMRAPRKAVNYLYNIILKGDGMGRDIEEGLFGKKKPDKITGTFKVVDGQHKNTIKGGFKTKDDAYDWLENNKEPEEYSKYSVIAESINEDINNISLDTDDSHMEVNQDENGKVTISTEPINNATPGEEVIAPLEPEVQNEISDNVADGEEIEIDVDEFDEESFDELGESYLKKVYENIDTYKTSQVSLDENTLKVEGMIKFKSGNTKKTSFLFEARTATKTGKVKFIGENTQITKGKKAFTITGNINNKKFLSESLTYNYGAKTPEGKTKRLYGTIKK